jgi:hypothetical protein
MNVNSCLKVNKCLLYRAVTLKLEEVSSIYYARCAAPHGHCGASVARRVLRVRTVRLYPDGCGRSVR